MHSYCVLVLFLSVVSVYITFPAIHFLLSSSLAAFIKTYRCFSFNRVMCVCKCAQGSYLGGFCGINAHLFFTYKFHSSFFIYYSSVLSNSLCMRLVSLRINEKKTKILITRYVFTVVFFCRCFLSITNFLVECVVNIS